MKNSKTLFIADLDGTLLGNGAELSEYSKASLNEMIGQGLYISAATARTYATAAKIVSEVNWNVPLALFNGALIYDMGRSQSALIHEINEIAIKAVLKVLKKHSASGILYKFENNAQISYYETLGSSAVRQFIAYRNARYNKEFIKANSFQAIVPKCIACFAVLGQYDEIVAVQSDLLSVADISAIAYKERYIESVWCLEIYSEQSSKQNAINWLREQYGFGCVVGFGDSANDLPMLKACDVRVAVGNADPELKRAAHYICETNERDGVVRWISSYTKNI
ncbi:MAG: Cof-type HAD-IIB family hydrolase [Eubacteriaceae bacterium]|nr:Cof-type HAD-IIB family hydrolase [Eubacteriaceae bacterium]